MHNMGMLYSIYIVCICIIIFVCLPAKVKGQNNTSSYQLCPLYIYIYIYINRTYYIATINSFARTPCAILFLVYFSCIWHIIYLLLTHDYSNLFRHQACIRNNIYIVMVQKHTLIHTTKTAILKASNIFSYRRGPRDFRQT